jgi:ABC-type nitrate/sulfonate/bicarbonate transport system substrate-binding protein
MPSDTLKIYSRVLNWCLLLVCWLAVPVLPATAASPPVELRVGYQPISSPTGAVFEVAKRDRLLRQGLGRHNIRLSFVPFKKGSDSIAAFKRGELEAIALGDMPMIEFALSTPVTIVGQMRQGFSTVVAPRGTTPKDLKGKRIGNAFASAGHYALLKTLQNGGLTERDITLVPLDVNQMPETLLKGTIDAFSAWEPTPALFIAHHPDRFSSVGRQSGSGYLSVTRTFANRHPESVSLLAAGLARAMQWLAKEGGNRQQAASWNRAAILQLSGTESLLTTGELSRQLTADLQVMHHSAKLPTLKDSGTNLLADEFRFLKDIGKLPQSAHWETIRTSFDHGIMERIYRNPSASLLNRFDYELR